MNKKSYISYIKNWRNRNYSYLLLLLSVTLLVFHTSLSNLLLDGWDDGWQVTNFYTSGGLVWENIRDIFTESYYGQYSPMNQLMYLVIYSIGGYNPFYFHLVSLLLHIANVCMVFFIVQHLLTDTRRLQNRKRIMEISAITSLLFSIHPLQVEAVAWISASKVLLFSFFYLAGTLTFIKYIKTQKKWLYIATILLFLLSFGSKEQALSFPVWIVCLYWIYGYSLKNIKTWYQITPFIIIALVCGLFFLLVLSPSTNGEADVLYPLWQRVLYSLYSISEYLVKWFFPYKLLYYYPFPNEIGDALPTWIFAYPLLLTTIVVVFWKYISHWTVASGLLFFLLHVSLMLHIIPMDRPTITADRYTYLASIGFSFIVAYVFFFLYDRWKKSRMYVVSALGIIIVILSIYSSYRVSVWHDTESVKKDLNEIIKQNQSTETSLKELQKE